MVKLKSKFKKLPRGPLIEVHKQIVFWQKKKKKLWTDRASDRPKKMRGAAIAKARKPKITNIFE